MLSRLSPERTLLPAPLASMPVPQAGSGTRQRWRSTARLAPSCRPLQRRRHTACSAASGPAQVRPQLLDCAQRCQTSAVSAKPLIDNQDVAPC
jgi:hypothetical protein